MVTLKIRSPNNVSVHVCKNPSTGSEDNAQKQSYADANGFSTTNNMSPSIHLGVPKNKFYNLGPEYAIYNIISQAASHRS